MYCRIASLIVLLVVAVPAVADDNAPNAELTRVKEHELDIVRQRISELKERMDKSAAERDRLTTELQAEEIRIAGQRSKLEQIDRRRRSATEKKSQLENELAATQASLEQESTALGVQLRAAFMSGGEERLQLLLNQQDPATLGRMMVYYRYLNDHRASVIAGVAEQLATLDRLFREIATEEQRLTDLASERYRELSTLGAAQEKRAAVLASLRQEIAEQGQEVERLARDEKSLTRLIAELTSILSDYPISSEEPFSALKGKLTWPVAGALLHDFGQPRAGGDLKWNGVVLGAPRGREVRAVYHGRVAFADWLAGMGLIVIVDHGEGFMTLYGYNETLLKNAGDWVAPGDVIATVGESGGQSEAGLYFELRRGTQPINPRQWVTRRPGG
jgi:septal ring factor EnvC (AmiA/AmiB activator)